MVAAAAATLGLGASAALAATDTTEPGGDTAASEPMTSEPMDMGSMPMDTMAPASPQEVDGSAEATSPEHETFCAAMLELYSAFSAEDQERIGPAVEAANAAVPDDIAPALGELLANAEGGPGDPAFDAPFAEVSEYLLANCGYAELNVAASEYAFGGIPGEVVAGPTIITLENIGEELHEIVLVRFNDDVDLTPEELFELSDEEFEASATFAAFAFAMPGTASYGWADLEPGRYAAVCFIPEGTTPEVFAQMEGPPDTGVPGTAGATEGTAAATEGTAAATEGTAAATEGSAPEGSAPPGEGTPHALLGMVQEFTVS